MLPLVKIAQNNEKKLAGLHPKVAQSARALIAACYKRGVQILITYGYRSNAEQNSLYAIGRTVQKGKPAVTNAKGGESYHNYGLAIDFVILDLMTGKKAIWDTAVDQDKDKKADWMEVVEEAKKLGFEWGGDWKKFVDKPHLQMDFGFTIAQLKAGKRPK